jgi:hypothetical protein
MSGFGTFRKCRNAATMSAPGSNPDWIWLADELMHGGGASYSTAALTGGAQRANRKWSRRWWRAHSWLASDDFEARACRGIAENARRTDYADILRTVAADQTNNRALVH